MSLLEVLLLALVQVALAAKFYAVQNVAQTVVLWLWDVWVVC